MINEKLDANQRRIPVYIDFGMAEEGPLVLYGLNTRKLYPLPGKVMDCGGFEISYMPNRRATGRTELTHKLMGLSKNSFVWLRGDFEKSRTFYVSNGGERKDFSHPEVLDEATKQFKRFLDTDVFTYCGRTRGELLFDVKGRIKNMAEDSVAITNGNDDVVGFVVEKKEEFYPHDGEIRSFRASVPKETMRLSIKALRPRI